MSILIDRNTKVITQGITGKTGQFHTRMCREYANGSNAYVAGVNPKKAGEDFEGFPSLQPSWRRRKRPEPPSA
jgi:succinyl-CoA synthetase alpha subunit